MARFIEADVIQKIATESEWLTQTRIPYQGQIMLVGDSSGKVVNIKVGDGVNPFADLNYMFDSIQQNAQYVPITSNALPTPVADPAWGMVTEGVYTDGGSAAFTVPAGHWGIANYSSGVWSLVDMGELPVDPNSVKKSDIDVAGGVAGFDRFESVENLTIQSANMSDNVFVLGAYNVSNGNNATSSNIKRLPRQTITEDMVGQNTISGGGIIPSVFARVTVRAAGGGAQALVIAGSGDSSPDSADLKPLTFEITSAMVGLTIGFTIGTTSSEPVDGYENHFMWNKGTVPLPFIPKGELVIDGSKVQNAKSPVFNEPNTSTEYGITWKAVENNAFIIDDAKIEKSKNRFDKSNVNVGFMNNTGVIGNSATNYVYTAPIDVSELGDNIFGSGTQGSSNQNGFRFVTAFDSEMNILSTKGLDGGSNASISQYIKDSTVSYIVATIYAVNIDTFQIEEGTSRSEYEEFGDFLVGLKDLKIKSGNSDKTSITSVEIVGDSTSAPEVDGVELGKSWSELLKQKLEPLGYQVIINASPGATAQEINSRIGFSVPRIQFANPLVVNTNVQATILDIDPVRAANILSYNARIVSGDIIINGVFSKASANASTRRFLAFSLPDNYTHDPNRVYRMYSNDSKSMVNDNTLLITGFGANNINPTFIGDNTDIPALKKEVVKASTYKNCLYWGQTNRTVAEYTNVVAEMENYCELTLGPNFIPFRKYLSSSDALKDALIYNPTFVPTSDDTTAVSQNNIPPSFKTGVSSAHLNELGHWLQAQFIFNWINQFYL